VTTENKRAIASLANIHGYHVLLTEVVKSKLETALEKLHTAKGQENIVNAALEFRIWDSVMKDLESAPKRAVDELKEEGDVIYG